jgi:hypothetical protein
MRELVAFSELRLDLVLPKWRIPVEQAFIGNSGKPVLLVLLLGVPLSSIREWISNSILWSDSGSYFPSSRSDEDGGCGPGWDTLRVKS